MDGIVSSDVPPAMPRNAMPDFILPQHPLLASRAPHGEQCLHEIKFDGYRVQLRVQKKSAAVRH